MEKNFSIEQEVKIKIESPEEVRRAVRELKASPVVGRTFEDNRLYDYPDNELYRNGRLLRIRKFGDRAYLTLKSAIRGASQEVKERLEVQSEIFDPEAVASIFSMLGLKARYRYQKYREIYELDGAEIQIDETPIGDYMEIEGDVKTIGKIAGLLGYDESGYITLSYAALHMEREGIDDPLKLPDMLFPEGNK